MRQNIKKYYIKIKKMKYYIKKMKARKLTTNQATNHYLYAAKNDEFLWHYLCHFQQKLLKNWMLADNLAVDISS